MESQQSDLSFHPLTEGLGFHPFSDGLPYAPVVKSAPLQKLPRRGLEVAVPIARKVQSSPVPIPVNSIIPSLATIEWASYRGYTYLFRRCGAYVLDSLFNILFTSGILGGLVWHQGMSLGVLMNSNVLLVTLLTLGSVNWVLVAFQEVFFGTSLGKRAFFLKLQGHGGLLLLRAFIFVPSAGVAGFGLIWSLFSPRKACWHDWVVGIQPIELHE